LKTVDHVCNFAAALPRINGLRKEACLVDSAKLFDLVVVPRIEKHFVAVALEQFPLGSHDGVFSAELLVSPVYD
jgi:hypothetical protein